MQIKLIDHHAVTSGNTGAVKTALDIYLAANASGIGDAEILRSVLALAPADYGGAPLSNLRITGGGRERKIEVSYALPDTGASDASLRPVKRSGDRIWRFGYRQITRATATGLELLQQAASGGDLPDPGCFLPPGGVPLQHIRLQEHCIATYTANGMTSAQKAAILALAGSINSSPFRNYAAGELRFLGCTQSEPFRNASGVWLRDCVFDFEAIANATDPEFAGLQFSGTVSGWDYPWCVRRHRIINGTYTADAKAIYLTRVYPRADFTRLGIGEESTEDDILHRYGEQ